MRIGINALFLRQPGTGIGQVTWHFLDQLFRLPEAKEHQFLLYVLEDFDRGDWPQNVHIRVLNPWWPRADEFRKYLFETKSLQEASQGDQCQIFFSLYQSATVMDGIPHIMLVHDIIPEIFPEYQRTLRKQFFWSRVRQAIQKATNIITVSEHTKNDILKHFALDKNMIEVCMPGVDPLFQQELLLPEKARVALKYSLPPRYIYHGGGLEVRKNTEIVLRAYASLLRILPERERLPLVISGTIHSESNPLATPVRALIRELGIEEKVILLGYVSKEDLPSLYALAQMFVYPSRYEGFGLPVLEAMTVGVPVITTRVSSLPEVGGTAVVYVHPDDQEALARSMKKLLHDKELHHKLVEDGREVAINFGWRSFVDGIWRILMKQI